MHETLLKYNENAMQEHIMTISQSPTQKFQEKLKNAKNFEKPKNLGLKCMKRENIRIEYLPSVLILI